MTNSKSPLKEYDVYEYDPWGAHHSIVKAHNKTEIYDAKKKKGYKRTDLEIFERR
jgi:hypothetical protein